jgi:excisionase family DNA binding protein
MAEQDLIGVQDVAAMVKTPASWVYGKVERGEIPHFKLGKYLRFDRATVVQWIEQQRRGPGVTERKCR